MLHAGRRKAGLAHPCLTIGARIFEAALSFDQHVQAGQKAEGILAAVIVKNRIVGDDRAAFRKRLKRLAEQRFLLAQIPIMQKWPITITSVFGNASAKKSPPLNTTLSERLWPATKSSNTGRTRGRSKPMPRRCGWA